MNPFCMHERCLVRVANTLFASMYAAYDALSGLAQADPCRTPRTAFEPPCVRRGAGRHEGQDWQSRTRHSGCDSTQR